MRATYLFLFLFLFCWQAANSQSIRIQPYLQDVEPNQAHILWETDSEEESIVEWGLTEALGFETSGIAYTSEGAANVHEVRLDGLERFTRYYYRVRTETAVSEIHSFRTPPFASDEQSFKLVAMSDMQRDNSFPDKFREIVEEGVIEYLTGGDTELEDELALVMIPGDLVTTGTNYNQWKNTFFDPSSALFSHVPVYPVLGNHENNAAYYYTYFKLPENGSPDFTEHWWFKDYSNLRIIGLDSNGPFTNAEQLAWLDNLLEQTCEASSIDFVFAQLHHPHKSELWTPGESNFTGEVIQRLEQFSTTCGKPSVHLFGHTHGYSRGQSRDHKHLWINVASAGGAIDNWGEFPNADYEEFSVSQDEYGFVVAEVTAGDAPQVTIKRISRGDQDMVIDNQLTDSLVIRLDAPEIGTPVAEYPVDIELAPECVLLQASPFESTAATHGQSHWQVTSTEDDFTNPVFESWKNFENWYFDIDTQAGDDLTDEEAYELQAGQTYWWRVRYRDREFNWSEWSSPASFTTGAAMTPPNLLNNPGAEEELVGWTVIQGVMESLTNGICDGVAPHSGERYFTVGGLCEHSEEAVARQTVDLSAYADSIATGSFSVEFGAYLSNFSGSDRPEMKLIFQDDNGMSTGESNTLTTLSNNWTLVSEALAIPLGTSQAVVELKGTRNAGTDNDSYFDDLFLRVGTVEINCPPLTSVSGANSSPILELNPSPNPMQAYTRIRLPARIFEPLQLRMVDATGRKVAVEYQQFADSLRLERGDLTAGAYVFWLSGSQGVIGSGKLVVAKP
ncbi:MAG: FN3 domain-containing metallophosphoesterase family protein [Bacteroidota bacterium]